MLFLLASCGGGGGGGGSGGGQGGLSVNLAFTPGDGRVTVDLVEKGPLVRLLNISTYQLTAIDSANETIRIEGDRLAEKTFNGSVLENLTNDRNYTFTLRVFYFPVGSAVLSNLSVRVDYAEEANVRNRRDDGGITIGSNRDGDYLADLVDADDDNDGLNDLDTNGMALDECPRGELNWQSDNMTDNDGDGCRDAGEDSDDDNDEVGDLMDECPRGELNWQSDNMTDIDGDGCRDAGEDSDDDNDEVNDVMDDCPRGEQGWRSNATTDIDGDGCRDAGEDKDDDNDEVNDVMDDCPRGEQGWRSDVTTDNDGDGCRDAGEDRDDDNDMLADTEDSGEYKGRLCRLFADCDNDTLLDLEDLGQFESEPCRANPDCDGDGERDVSELAGCGQTVDCDSDGEQDGVDIDDDGDGLIEVRTTAELDAVRWSLNGSGRRMSEIAALDRTGCGADRTACSGYELVRDISLAAYASGSGWAPLGRDTDSGTDGCQGTAFDGIFDGNGRTVRGLNISRSEEDCIGLFGHLAAGTVIRNLTVRAEAVIGRDRVGGLVGSGDSAEIVSSFSVAGEVRGSSSAVGGLVGRGQNAEIVSSFSVAGEVRGSGIAVGGLVGWGRNAEIVSSSSVVGEVRGDSFYVGGLVGWGVNAEIVSSSSVVGEVRGDNSNVGGLVGRGQNAEIVSSSSVVGGVRGSSFVGGLVGFGGDVDSSYWYTAVALADNGKGEEKTLAELRTPTNDNAYDMGSIYANWTRGADIDDMAGVEDITRWCDEDLSGAIETDEMRDGSGSGDDNRIWDFGGTSDYPAIRCLPLSLTEQRSWWFINSTTNRPQLNQDRLDALTSP